MSYWKAATLIVMTSALSACEHGEPLVDGMDDGLQPTLKSIQEHIFDTSCALSNCHVGPNAQLGLDLSAGNARASLVNVASARVPGLLRVEPGNSDDSYLILKLEGDERIIGARMPFNLAPLPSESISIIREWIDGGAE